MHDLRIAIWCHAQDRGLVHWTLIRLLLCGSVAVAPWLVAIPTWGDLASASYFYPLLFGILGAASLREQSLWLRPRRMGLIFIRAMTTFAADCLCISWLFLIPGLADTKGLIYGSVLAIAIAMLTAKFTPDYAWLTAALVGAFCLLNFGEPAIRYIPPVLALATYGVGIACFAAKGAPAPNLDLSSSR